MKIEKCYKLMGQRIKYARTALGITQETLASRMKLSRTSIVNIENGNQRILAHQVIALSGILKVTPGFLYGNTLSAATDEKRIREQIKERQRALTAIQARFAREVKELLK